MKKTILYANCILLALLSAFGAGGCAHTPATVQTGIVIVQSGSPVYSEEEVSTLQENVYALLLTYTKANKTANPTEKMKANLQGYAKQIVGVISGMGMSLRSFSALTALCGKEESGEEIASFTPSSLSAFYADIASAIGFNNAGILSYRLILLYYDILYSQSMDRYQTYGYSYLLTQAEKTAAEKELFETEIGESNFLLAAQTACGVCALGDSLGTSLAALSDGEILTLLQAQKSTSLTLSAEGWKLLFSYLQRLLANEYWGDLLAAAQKNGDIEIVASQMNGVMQLLKSIQSKLTTEEITLLKEGKKEELLLKIYSSLSEDDLALADSVLTELSGMPPTTDYDEAASARFGEAYEEYKQGVKTYSLSEVKTNILKVDILKLLEGFTAGISPAVAYGIFR